MQIQLNTDNNITGSPELLSRIQKVIDHELRHHAASITRVEAHINDTNSAKKGEQDKRCMLEARIAGMKPLSVEHRADTVSLAVSGAASQLARLVDTTLGKANGSEKGGVSIRHLSQNEQEE
ncbi:HPF/RaiA family ribosome-associated protein [Noviherbaspirillum sp. CPCC 100848]|uniref:HPF/RaiA family ribosome-associated protein n=1 Tax=Noviherbaspirillum album TaxID=3080276 RepID=A0ABU6J2I8_9BURK|nr:HPF/RaiA family ribosome-associated protein [Noviherbaspirillum sp. CPCC 100848]MEC4717829.1 HPF/RaiA family ribosome-associated protein [Noviherbaspirillum sp. CPCC 100848]